MPPTAPVTKRPAVFAEGERADERVVSLNADGSRNWFIPPYVVPGAIIALVAVHALYRG